jgi:hypothetical protein
VSPGVGRTLADRFAFSSGYGAFLWLLVAATGCAVAGTVAAVRLALAEPAPTGGAAPEPSRPVPAEPGEELHW